MNGHDGREASDGDICAITALSGQTESTLQELDELAADASAYEYRTPKSPIICALIRLLMESDGFGN